MYKQEIGLRFRVSEEGRGNLAFIPFEATEEMFDFAGVPPETPVADITKPIHVQDQLAVDEWEEFVTKVRVNPNFSNFDKCTDNHYEKTLLQFFQFRMEWKTVTVGFDTGQDIGSVRFAEPSGEFLNIGLWHWRENSLTVRLGRMMTEGSYFDMDLRKNLMFISKNLAQTGGFGQSAMVTTVDEYLAPIHPDDKEAVRAALRNIGQGQSMVENRGIRPDGRVMHFVTYAIPIFDGEGEVSRIFGRVSDVSSQVETQNTLKALVERDTLTGAYNRNSFDKRLKAIIEGGETSHGVISADINGLQRCNDIYGRAEGDALLVEAAEILRTAMAGRGTLFRVGGDDFVIVLENADRATCESIGCAVDDACLHTRPRNISLGISWGGAVQHDDEDINNAYKRAEKRMGRRKLLDDGSFYHELTKAIQQLLKSHHGETAEHMARMDKMMVALGKHINLPDYHIVEGSLLAYTHDLGKVGVPVNIINKGSPLEAGEWAVMKSHCTIGHDIARAMRDFSCIAEEILCHHERWDGTGYPKRRRADEIPLLSRMVSIVDTYDVITNWRPYKQPRTHEEAVREIKRCAGTQFDPNLVDAFLDLNGAAPAGELCYVGKSYKPEKGISV